MATGRLPANVRAVKLDPAEERRTQVARLRLKWAIRAGVWPWGPPEDGPDDPPEEHSAAPRAG